MGYATGRPAQFDMPLALVAALAAMTLVRTVVAVSTGLTDDEAYYRMWALAPSLSYYDHAPMAGWLITATRAIFGDNNFGIRLPSILIGLVGPLLLWRTARILFDRETAIWAVGFALAMPLLAVGGVIITPDAPSVLFWGLTAWAMAELYTSDNPHWWLMVGLMAGLGLVSKYTNLIVGAGILLWIVLVPGNRKWLRSWQLWAGGAIALACTVPVVIWNAQHDWASLIKQFGRAVPRGGITATYLIELLGSYLGLASPIIAVLGLMGLSRFVKLWRTQGDARAGLVVCGVLPLLFYFFVHGLHSRVQANWAAPLYPTLALLGAHVLVTSNPVTRPRWALASVGFGVAATIAIFLHALWPAVVIPGSHDPTSQMRGWPELAQEVEKLRVQNGGKWIATGRYATTGQLAYVLKGATPVEQLRERIRYVHLPKLERATLSAPAVFVEVEDGSNLGFLQNRFRKVRLIDTIERRAFGVSVGTYSVFLVAEPKEPDALLTYARGRE